MRGMSYRALRLVALLETVSFAVLLVGSVLARSLRAALRRGAAVSP